jgi:hypothetical protein
MSLATRRGGMRVLTDESSSTRLAQKVKAGVEISGYRRRQRGMSKAADGQRRDGGLEVSMREQSELGWERR